MADYSEAYNFKSEPKKKAKHAKEEDVTFALTSDLGNNFVGGGGVQPDWGYDSQYTQVVTKRTVRTYKSYNDEGKLESEEVEETIEYAPAQDNTPWIITNSSNTTVG